MIRWPQWGYVHEQSADGTDEHRLHLGPIRLATSNDDRKRMFVFAWIRDWRSR